MEFQAAGASARCVEVFEHRVGTKVNVVELGC